MAIKEAHLNIVLINEPNNTGQPQYKITCRVVNSSDSEVNKIAPKRTAIINALIDATVDGPAVITSQTLQKPIRMMSVYEALIKGSNQHLRKQKKPFHTIVTVKQDLQQKWDNISPSPIWFAMIPITNVTDDILDFLQKQKQEIAHIRNYINTRR